MILFLPGQRPATLFIASSPGKYKTILKSRIQWILKSIFLGVWGFVCLVGFCRCFEGCFGLWFCVVYLVFDFWSG